MSETLEEIAERLVELSQHTIIDGELKQVVLSALRNERERAAKAADAVENKWTEDARSVARADDLVGSLAQSTYNNYAEVAHNIARAIREGR